MTLRPRVRHGRPGPKHPGAFRGLEGRSRAGTGRLAARRAAAGWVMASAAFATLACGTPSPDLFVVERYGTVPGARLTLLVSDQTARCNDGPARNLTSGQIIEARDIKRDLLLVQTGGEPIPEAPPAQIFRFAVRTEEGTLRYPDTQQRPQVLPRLSRFVRRIAIDTCGLER